MRVLQAIGKRSERLARCSAALFAVFWLSVVAVPCAMAWQSEVGSAAAGDCPHCPPQPCHEEPARACELPDLDALPGMDKHFPVALAATTLELSLAVPARALRPRAASFVLARAGPRAHLLNARFNE